MAGIMSGAFCVFRSTAATFPGSRFSSGSLPHTIQSFIDLMPAPTQPEIVRFAQDMTLRWPCRRGDFILWIRYSNIFAGTESLKIYDLWEMRDGYHVTITNRPEDFPAWFELHPTEVCNSLALKLAARIEKGQYPKVPLDGPNLWRLKSGDRVAWVGAGRPERPSVDGILAVVDCRESALAVGEGDRGGLEEFVGFGAPTTRNIKPEDAACCRAAVEVVKQLGLARSWGPEWRLG